MSLFALQIINQPMRFKIFSFAQLDFNLLALMMTVMFSYTIVLFQYEFNI